MLKLGPLLIAIGLVILSQVAPAQTQSPQAQTEQQTEESKAQQQPTSPDQETTYNWMVRGKQVISAYLQHASNYCATESTKKEEKWFQDFLCGVKITDVVIAIFSILLVFVTVGLVLIGWIQARRMRVTARQQLRAYIFVDGIWIGNVTTPLAWEVGPDYKPTGAEITHTNLGPAVRIAIKNSGQTPAYKVVHFGEYFSENFLSNLSCGVQGGRFSSPRAICLQAG
jgi:hypothetical protein